MSDKKLYRLAANRMIAGVAGGFGEYFNIDATIIRLLFVVAAFAGPGIPFYIISWIIIPKQPKV